YVNQNLMSILILINILCGSISCSQKTKVIGHWRPADTFKPRQETIAGSLDYRDLILNDDYTFVAVGLEHESKKTEGWNNGETQKGEWNSTKSILPLHIDGISLPVKFKILQL